MTVAIRDASSSTQPDDNVNAINANLHFTVSEALTESKLLECVREYRRLCLEIASVNSELSEQQLANRADIMLQLKDASEQFNTLLSPVDVVHMQVLRQLKLEQILSRYYWHAKYSLSVVGFDVVNSAVEIDADVYTDPDGKRLVKTELPSISPEVLSAITPNSAPSVPANESVDASTSESTLGTEHTKPEPASVGPINSLISSVVIGISALLLLVLATSVFASGFVNKIQTHVPVDSWSYRLAMLTLLLILTTSIYLIISRAISTTSGNILAVGNRDKKNKNSGLFSGLLNISASPGRIFTLVSLCYLRA